MTFMQLAMMDPHAKGSFGPKSSEVKNEYQRPMTRIMSSEDLETTNNFAYNFDVRDVLAVADPGFLRGAPQSLREDANLLLDLFSRKLHENEEILAERGRDARP